jgi:hypothetical protein
MLTSAVGLKRVAKLFGPIGSHARNCCGAPFSFLNPAKMDLARPPSESQMLTTDKSTTDRRGLDR